MSSVLPTSATEYSQAIKGNQSYYYWHSTVAKGEDAVPKPTPKLLATEAARESGPPVINLTKYSFLDDSNVVKVYIPLAGELDGLKTEGVQSEFSPRALHI